MFDDCNTFFKGKPDGRVATATALTVAAHKSSWSVRLAADICKRHGIPVAFLDADPSDADTWVAEARARIDALLATGP